MALKSAYDPKIPALVGQVSGRVWEADKKLWTVPISSVHQLAEKMVKERVWNERDAAEVIELVGKITNYKDSDISLIEKSTVLPLRDYQKETLKFFINRGSALGALDMGTGKAQPVDSPVLTPKGFRPIGELKINDDIIGIDGETHKVIGVFPQGKKMIYRVTFSDKTTTRCCEEHLWTVRTYTMKARKNGYKVIKLRELMKNLHWKNGDNKWYIPISQEVEFTALTTPLPIHPYLLGIILGDSSITYHKDRNYITTKLKELKLAGFTPLNKFIPEIYKLASVEDRKALIQGLIDTDGWILKEGKVEYYSSSKQMIEDVQFIIETLGGSATLSQRVPKYNYKNKLCKGATAYRLNIRLPNNGFIPATLTQKVVNYKKNLFFWEVHRSISSIEPIGESEAICIKTSAPNELYLTDHCIVTHNTAISLAYSHHLKQKAKIEKTLFVVPIAVLWHWKDEATKFFGDKLKMCVVGYETTKKGKIKRVNKDVRKAQLLSTEYDGYIINYEKLGTILNDPEIKAMWDNTHRYLLVADEVTRIKNWSAVRTKHLKAIPATYRIGLSGRPIENNLFEFYTILDWIWPRCLGTWGQFKDKFIVTDRWGNIIKTKEQQTLKEIARYIAIQYSRYDVMKELPPLIVNQYDVELSNDEEQDYAKITGEIDNAIESLRHSEKKEGIINILALLGMSQMFCDHPLLVRMSDSPSAKSLNIVCGKSSKLDEFRIVLDEIISARKEKVVVFSKYKNMLNIIETDISRSNPLVKVYKYTGGISATNRKTIIDSFNSETNPAVFLSTDSAALGVELQTASYIINYDLPWNPAILDQRIARLHRSGQKNPVFVVNMVVKDADKVEARVLEIIRKKEKLYKDVMGDGELEIAVGTDKNKIWTH